MRRLSERISLTASQVRFDLGPPGKRDVAHQLINTGTTDLKYLALSTVQGHDVCEYPDSNKIGIRIGADPEKPALRALFRAEQSVDYWDREF